jgi:hypothetical protein
VFLRSLAEDQAEKSIAIILSGTGSDGMRGVRTIKENGGMVMVQDEDSAKFNGMPRSAISTGLPDFILKPSQMPRQLLSFIQRPYGSMAARSETLLSAEDGLTRIFALLRECMDELGMRRDVKIFATDIDRDAIHFAAAGVYPESVAADSPSSRTAYCSWERARPPARQLSISSFWTPRTKCTDQRARQRYSSILPMYRGPPIPERGN